MLSQKSQSVEDKLKIPLADPRESDPDQDVVLRTIEEQENDSGTETLQDTDSEPDDQFSKKDQLIEECTGWNVSM